MLRDTAQETRFDPPGAMASPANGRSWTCERPDNGLPVQAGGIGPTMPIATVSGPVLARDMRPGMQVHTLYHGVQRVLWCGQERQLHAQGQPSPVRLAPGAFGLSRRHGPGLLAPGQHLRVRHARNPVLFAADDVLCRARDLVHLPGIQHVKSRYAVNWVHVLFDGLEIIPAGGLWLESMQPDMPALRARHADLAEAIEAAVPALRFHCGQAAYARQMPVLNRAEVRLLGCQGMSG